MADHFIERRQNSAMVAVQETKEVAEVKAKMYLARQFPRDEDICLARILKECESPRLAEVAQYEYTKGKGDKVSVIKGPSIRLIEVISRHWGNLLSGITEMSKDGGRSTVKTYAWDLETNYADEKIFELDYIRNTKSGSYAISDEREKYELMANYAARRKRACIQAVVPGYIIDAAVEACERTLESTLKNGNKTIEQVRADMLKAFVGLADWITEDMLASSAGKDFDKLSPKDIVKLRNLYNAIKDGFVKAEVVFGKESEDGSVPSADETEGLDKLNEMLKAGQTENDTDKG
jgi:hypothetical protein